MELYKKKNCFTGEIDYQIVPEKEDRPREYYDGPAGDILCYFVDYVKSGERFYTFYCRNTNYESDICWEKEEAKNEMEHYRQDLEAELDEEEIETWIVTYVVKRCGDVNDGGIDVKV